LLASASAETGTGPDVPLFAIIPFVTLLGMIAMMPFIHKHWWEHHYPKVSVGLGVVSVLFYLLVMKEPGRVMHTGLEYFSFISLIGGLFVVAGGIVIRTKGEATPMRNTLFLLIGSVLANVVGTTGASMLLIRPWIRMNRYRITAFHIVFFIFIVSNVSGCLTPIGDPPLFLGYLKHVPFWWELQRLLPMWSVAVGLLLVIFYLWDSVNFRRAPKAVRTSETQEETWRFQGGRNILWLAVILGCVFLATPWREVGMLAAAAASYRLTPKDLHEANDFGFGPIKEVAWLFLGIFATMIPALHYLELHAADLAIDTAMKFYWFTGALSSVLDNAPTYLTFLTASVSQHVSFMDAHRLSVDSLQDMREYMTIAEAQLEAISLGAVFFGAMTYIGNGPNFMVKAIADQANVHTPSFFAYIVRFSLPVLLPVLAVVGYIFFRHQ
jgi:Na+/H+ antiporter NhaD/arsenite permease-like protein